MDKKDILEQLYALADVARDKAIELTANLDNKADQVYYLHQFSKLRSYFRDELIRVEEIARLEERLVDMQGGIMAFIVIASCAIIGYIIWSNPGTVL